MAVDPNISDDELNKLVAQKLQADDSGFSDNSNLSDEQLNMMVAEKLAREDELQAQGGAKVNFSREAELGPMLRGQYAIEPIESNRNALLVQEFGRDRVKKLPGGDTIVLQSTGNKYEWRPVNKPGFSTADVADIAGSLPEMIGTAVGGLAGAPTGVGAIATGAAGGAVGSAARQFLSSQLGTPQIAEPMERVSHAGLSAVFGGAVPLAGMGIKAAAPTIGRAGAAVGELVKKTPVVGPVVETVETAAKSTGEVISNLKKALTTKVAKDAPEFFAIAEKHGIDKSLLPEAVEFGPTSAVSRGARVAAEGPFGEERLARYAQAQQQVSNAVSAELDRLAPMRPQGAVDSGQFIVDSVNESVKDFFGNLGETYSNMVKNAPGVKLSPQSQKNIASKLEGIRTFAIGRTTRGIGSQKQEAKSLLEAVKSLKNNNGSLKQITEALQNIGEEAFKKGSAQNRLPVDRQRLQQLYFDVQKEVIGTVREVFGEEAAENLVRNNKLIHDFLGQNSILQKTIGRDAIAPERVFDSLIKNGDTKKIEALTSIIGTEKTNQIRGSFLDSLIKRNDDGVIMVKQTMNALEKNKPVLSKLFKPDEIKEIGDLLRLQDRFGPPVMSSSGTGASNAFLDFFRKARASAISETGMELSKKRAREEAARELLPQTPGVFRRTAEFIGPEGAAIMGTQQFRREKSNEARSPGKR